jgi:hypothetical protein
LREARVFEAPGGTISWAKIVAERPPSHAHLLAMARLHDVEDVDHIDVGVDVSAPPRVSADERLRARLEEALTLVSLDGEARSEMAAWPLRFEPRGGRVAVELVKGATRVDLEHPLVKLALHEEDGVAAAFVMLCAVVYDAVNAHLDRVTDNHERAFVARLLEHASGATGATGSGDKAGRIGA